MKTLEEKIEIMRAYADGKSVESKSLNMIDPNGTELGWEDVKTPTWNWGLCDYRLRESSEVMKLCGGQCVHIGSLTFYGDFFVGVTLWGTLAIGRRRGPNMLHDTVLLEGPGLREAVAHFKSMFDEREARANVEA